MEGVEVVLGTLLKYAVKCAVWYEKVPDEVRVSEDGNVEIWWDRSIKTAQMMEHNHPDIIYCGGSSSSRVDVRQFLSALGLEHDD